MIEDMGSIRNNIRPRPTDENPRNPFCRLHLQRICGTCAHYGGALRDGAAEAPCAALHFTAARLSNAADCTRWQRKSAQGGGE